MNAQQDTAAPVFDTGTVVVTEGIRLRMADEPSFAAFVGKALGRHVYGDWGDLMLTDKHMNNEALVQGQRLLSMYEYLDCKIWVITEGDRSSTTVLFPEEY